MSLDVQEVSKPQEQPTSYSPSSAEQEKRHSSINLELDKHVCFPDVPLKPVPILLSSSKHKFSDEREMNSVCPASKIRFQFAVRTLIKTLIDQLYCGKLSAPLLL